jgi:GH18 family chitinase
MQNPRLIGYFPAEAIHQQNYYVADIPADRLSHVIYAFAGISPAGDCISVNGDDDAINFPQLRMLKQRQPMLQTLISIGGASHSEFSGVAENDATRRHFARSAVHFMNENGFDGIDIDWEYPTAADTQQFTALLKELRRELDSLGAVDQRSYLLTIAAPAGRDHYSVLQLNRIHQYLDWIDLMSYDFATASSKKTDFVAPLKVYDTSIASHVYDNVDAAVQAYLKAGVPADKLVLGTRFVGTGWQGVANVNQGLYQSNGGPARGSWDTPGSAPSGSFGYQDLENNYRGVYTRYWHNEAKVPWLYNASTGITISYEDPQSLALKTLYGVANSLGGVMIWELAADDSQHTLLDAVRASLASYPLAGGPRLADFLDSLPILTRWLKGHPVVWQTGQQDGADEPNPDYHTHCSAFAAAAALYLDIYLLRPPNHGQVQLANAQRNWLFGRRIYPGPTAAESGWAALGYSGDPGVLTACLEAANKGQLVVACYAVMPPAHGHIAIVRPDKDGDTKVPPDGPAVIMAGEQNYKAVSMKEAFSEHPKAWPDNIALFVHDTPLQQDAVG